MQNSYSEEMQRLENEYYRFMQKATEEYANNKNIHSKQECLYLQKAADCRAQMARMSSGSEKEYQAQKVRELNSRIKDAIMEFDPEYFIRSKNAAASSPSTSGSGASSNANASPKSKGTVSEETIKSWFKKIPVRSFDDVSGMDALKEKLNACINDSKLDHIKEYLGLSRQKSYLFAGPPGCGKTYIIGAFVHELVGDNFKYISLESSDILSKYVGEAETIISTMFAEAEAAEHCVIFIDEIDGVCKDRSGPIPEYASSLTTAFLTGYNRIKESKAEVIFIGATNYIDQVDKAMRDRCEVIEVPYPDAGARTSKFSKELQMLQLEDGFSFERIAELTELPVYNYRDMERLCEEVKIFVIRDSIAKYADEDKAVSALISGEYRLSEQLFKMAQESCKPSAK